MISNIDNAHCGVLNDLKSHFKGNVVTWFQFHQHVTSSFFAKIPFAKLQTQNVRAEKLRKTISFKKN